VVINDGQRAAIAACVVRNGERGIGLLAQGAAPDPASYPVFVPVDWQMFVTLRLRRSAGGDAEIIEINGVTPNPRAILPAAQCAGPTRSVPSFEFGARSVEAFCTVEYTAFSSETVSLPVAGTLSFARFRIRDSESNDRLAFRAEYSLGPASNGIDPAVEPVTIRLATPGCCDFYTATLSGFTVHGRAPRRRWVLTDAERARTGIEQLVIDESPGNGGAIVLRDGRTELDDRYFGVVNASIGLGAGATGDALTGSARLHEQRAGSGIWRLDREA
jgi:hypothetical protein